MGIRNDTCGTRARVLQLESLYCVYSAFFLHYIFCDNFIIAKIEKQIDKFIVKEKYGV